jgi:dUTP pyrophosphatase
MTRSTSAKKSVTEAALLAETDAADLVMIAQPGGARLTRPTKKPGTPTLDPRHLSDEGRSVVTKQAEAPPVAPTIARVNILHGRAKPTDTEQEPAHFLKMVPLRVKRLTATARLPTRGSEEAIGYDCYADLPEPEYHPKRGILIPPHCRHLIPLGIAIAIPPGCYGRMAPRSGLALNQGVHIMAGVIDRDYRGALHALLLNTTGTFVTGANDRPEVSGGNHIRILHGMKVCQLILERARIVPVEEVTELDETARGDSGYGSTGA